MADLFKTEFHVEEEIKEYISNWLQREKMSWDDLKKILNSIGIFPAELRQGDESSSITIVTKEHQFVSMELAYDWRHTVIYIENQEVLTEYWVLTNPLQLIKRNSIFKYKNKTIKVIYKKDKKIELILSEKRKNLNIKIKECEDVTLQELLEYLSSLEKIDIIDIVNDIWENEAISSSEVKISLTEKD